MIIIFLKKQRICIKNISNNMYDFFEKLDNMYDFLKKPIICMKPEILPLQFQLILQKIFQKYKC